MLGGVLADWSIFRSLIGSSVAMGLSLALFTVTAKAVVPGLLTVFRSPPSGRCSWSTCRCG